MCSIVSKNTRQNTRLCCLNAADSLPSSDNSKKIMMAAFGAVLGFLIFGLLVMYRIFFRQGNVLSL